MLVLGIYGIELSCSRTFWMQVGRQNYQAQLRLGKAFTADGRVEISKHPLIQTLGLQHLASKVKSMDKILATGQILSIHHQTIQHQLMTISEDW
jgi:hypothetical protein